MMSEVVELATHKRKTRHKQHRDDARKVLKLTRQYYIDIKPYFKYRLVYEMGMNIMTFRDDLKFSIRKAHDKLRELK